MQVQLMGGPILTIYTSFDVLLRKELPFGSRYDCSCVKMFSGLYFTRGLHRSTWYRTPNS